MILKMEVVIVIIRILVRNNNENNSDHITANSKLNTIITGCSNNSGVVLEVFID